MARRKKFEPETLRVVDIDHQGRGITTGTDGKTVFVHGALPDELVTLQRVKRQRRFDEAKLLEIHEFSPSRVEPKCAGFSVCGGCSLQHLSSTDQIQAKQQQLLDALERIGHVKPIGVLPPITGQPWQYRRKARLAVRYVEKKERVLVGFRERLSHYIADISQCEVLADPVGQLIEPLSELVQSLSIRRHLPQIEVAVADNATVLVFRVLQPLTADDRDCLLRFAAEHQVYVYQQPGGLDTIAPLAESVDLFYQLPQQDLSLYFGPSDFVQINAAVNQEIISSTLDLLALTGSERVLDLFCGLGNFSLALARHCEALVGIEGSVDLVEQAQANAHRNGVSNTTFHVADLFKDIADFPWAQQTYDVVVLDPPRAGAKELLQHINLLNPTLVMYVSCHPGTLARDAEILSQAGYRLEKAGVADMFPHTAHVESMALFRQE